MHQAIMARTMIPPITPPATAPVLEDFFNGVDVALGVEEELELVVVEAVIDVPTVEVDECCDEVPDDEDGPARTLSTDDTAIGSGRVSVPFQRYICKEPTGMLNPI